jgi:hypothetical protein
VVAIAVLSSLGLVLLALLRGGILSSGRAAQEAFLLSNARKAFSGGGAKSGLLDDAQRAASLKSVDPGSLALLDPAGTENDYGVSPSGDFVATRAGTAETVALHFTSMTVTYYARTADYRVVESSDPTSADLVTVSLGATSKSKSLRLFSGARLMNAP